MPTATAVIDLNQVDEPMLLEALSATDADVRGVAVARLSAAMGPVRFAEKISQAQEGTEQDQFLGTLSSVGALVSSRDRDWQDAFWAALPSHALVLMEPVRLASEATRVDTPTSFHALMERIGRLPDQRERGRLAKAAVTSARAGGAWLAAAPSYVDSDIEAVRTEARADYIIALVDGGALARDLESRWASGPLPDWLVSTLAQNLRLPAVSPLLRSFAVSSEDRLWRGACLALVASGDDGGVVLALREHARVGILPAELIEALPLRLAYEAEWADQIPLSRLERDAASTLPDDAHAAKLAEAVCGRLGNAPSKRTRDGARAAAWHGGGAETRLSYLLHPEREALYGRLPGWLAEHPRIVAAAPARAVVRRLSVAPIGREAWASLPLAVRMVWTHKELWEAKALPASDPLVDDAEALLQSLRSLYDVSQSREPAEVRADAFDRQLRRFLLETIVERPDVVLDLRPLLPDCMFAVRRAHGLDQTPNVAHCEGRFWKQSKSNPSGHDAWCPRFARGCLKQIERSRPPTYSDALAGARTEAVSGLDWEYASLIEVFDRLRVEPRPPGMASNESYATALGGWANRLNEIRERLVCKVCSARLEPNFEYAKRQDARYNKTFFTCPNGHYPHPGRYFNHCWCCEMTIDSDESLHSARTIENHGFRHGLYYCIHCGAGPEPEKGGSSDVGTKCPACGANGPMDVVEIARDFVRLRCVSPNCSETGGHVIKTPLRAIKNRQIWSRDSGQPFRLPFWWPRDGGGY